MLFLSGSVVSTTTSMSGWASLSSTAPVWMRGGRTDGKTAPVTKLVRREANISIVQIKKELCLSG